VKPQCSNLIFLQILRHSSLLVLSNSLDDSADPCVSNPSAEKRLCGRAKRQRANTAA
jgi:hypothetical protein